MLKLPYNQIEDNRWSQLSLTMTTGNTLIKKWASTLLGNRKERQFRKRLFQGEFKGQISQGELESILAVKDIQDEVFCGYTRLASKIANKWCNDARHNKSHIEDYTQEALMALIEAIYGYTEGGVKFITYAWVTIQNRMKTFDVKEKNLIAPSKVHRALVSDYNKTKQKANGHMTFDETVTRMELSSVEIKLLGEALVKVTGESDFGTDDVSRQNPINNLVASSIPVEHACEVAEVQDAIENAGLTALERSALDASLNASHGWKKAFSDQHINPKTGKSYSRASVAIVLERAHQKVKTYLKVA
jgi:DNA-directed RNA polymerase specialized sigma subunit